MGNCISKINRDLFFAIKESMKNDILFSNGIKRLALDMTTRGTYRGYFYNKASRNNEVGSVANWGVVERTLKKWVRCMK